MLIENKIKVIAISKKEQVANQFLHFEESEDTDKSLRTYSLLITTDYDAFSSMYVNSVQTNLNSSWLKWTNNKEKENSIESILRQSLILEQQADIQPINPTHYLYLNLSWITLLRNIRTPLQAKEISVLTDPMK